MKPVFKNTLNECAKTEDGRTVFLSRSMAVCVPVTVLVKETKEIYELISTRGENTPDFQGCVNLVCGYLDYDEYLYEAAIREVWEETGLYLPSHTHEDNQRYARVPWGINDYPTPNGRQNVTMRFGYILHVDTVQALPALTTANAEEGEVADAQWMLRSDVFEIMDNQENLPISHELTWAFDHYNVFRKWAAISAMYIY